MIGGLMKTTSRFAFMAAASLLATTGVMAADLGGNCCADLEERVAELEATTARKGNRKVSLTVYGQVNEAVLFWDDGEETNAYVVTNENSRTRFGFRGDAKLNAEWSAGFLLEIGVRIANSAGVSQLVDDNTASTSSLDLRHSAWYLESNRLGRMWVGHTSMATDGITEINLSNAGTFAGPDINNFNGGFFLRAKNGDLLAVASGSSIVGLTWANINSQANANVGDGDRRNLVRYISPAFWGFTFSASWGEDDFWDTALRYANEWNGVRFAAGIGYQQWSDGDAFSRLPTYLGSGTTNLVSTGSQNDRGCADLSYLSSHNGSDVDCGALGLSASVMHVPTGLYLAGSYGILKDDNRRELFDVQTDGLISNAKDKDEFWYVQGGIERNWLGIGKSTFYGEYFHGNTGAGLSSGNVRNVGAFVPPPTIGPNDTFTNDLWVARSEVDMWGIGFVQTIDAAAMDLYIGFRQYSGDVHGVFRTQVFEEEGNLEEDESGSQKFKMENFNAIMAGGIIRF
jgi:hypothetical protein